MSGGIRPWLTTPWCARSRRLPDGHPSGRRRRAALPAARRGGGRSSLGVTSLSLRPERWPLKAAFVISRGTKTEARVVVAEIVDGPHRGRGEAVPYGRYGETVEGVLREIEGLRGPVEGGPWAQRVAKPAAARRSPQRARLRSSGTSEAGETRRSSRLVAGRSNPARSREDLFHNQSRRRGGHGRAGARQCAPSYAETEDHPAARTTCTLWPRCAPPRHAPG